MDAIETLKLDVQEGRISAERLVDLIASLQRQLQAAQQRIEQLEKQLGGASTTKLDEPFSMRAEEQRQEARGKKKRNQQRKGRRGRFKTKDKIAQAERTEPVFPEGVPPEACPVACPARLAAGKWPSAADRLPNLSRPPWAVWQNPRCIGP